MSVAWDKYWDEQSDNAREAHDRALDHLNEMVGQIEMQNATITGVTISGRPNDPKHYRFGIQEIARMELSSTELKMIEAQFAVERIQDTTR